MIYPTRSITLSDIHK